MGFAIQLGIVLLFLLLGMIAGGITESRHFRDLKRREDALANMVVTDLKTFPGGADPAAQPAMVVAEVVIANDYMKSFLAAIRKIIGGQVTSYLSLLERARREAILRILEQANKQGYDAVCNVRLETASIGSMGRKGTAIVGIIASGTAYALPREARA